TAHTENLRSECHSQLHGIDSRAQSFRPKNTAARASANEQRAINRGKNEKEETRQQQRNNHQQSEEREAGIFRTRGSEPPLQPIVATKFSSASGRTLLSCNTPANRDRDRE